MKKIMIATLAFTLFAGIASAQTTPAKPAKPTAAKPMMKKESKQATTKATTTAKPVAKDAATTGKTTMMRKHSIHKKTKSVPKTSGE